MKGEKSHFENETTASPKHWQRHAPAVEFGDGLKT
jgi:hypothetical protein